MPVCQTSRESYKEAGRNTAMVYAKSQISTGLASSRAFQRYMTYDNSILPNIGMLHIVGKLVNSAFQR